jgi:YggT family protein
MYALLYLFNTVVDLYWWIIVINAVLSWLIAFHVINTYNRFVAVLVDATYRLTEPLLRPIRRVLPDLGGLDISPIILLLLIGFLQRFINEMVLRSGAI